jgi:hypothetical protein
MLAGIFSYKFLLLRRRRFTPALPCHGVVWEGVNKCGKAVVNNELASFAHSFTIRFCEAKYSRLIHTKSGLDLWLVTGLLL